MMYYSRQRFDVNAGSGVWADTGPSFMGEVTQLAWNPSTPDTGGDLQITLRPAKGGDTGNGWSIYNDNDCLGADFIKATRVSRYGPDGVSDTGHTERVVSAGDRLRVKVTPGGAACVGKLYVWTRC